LGSISILQAPEGLQDHRPDAIDPSQRVANVGSSAIRDALLEPLKFTGRQSSRWPELDSPAADSYIRRERNQSESFRDVFDRQP